MSKQWIKAKNENPPEYDKCYLAYWQSGNCSVFYFWGCTWKELLQTSMNGDFITYYRELPEPPESDNG